MAPLAFLLLLVFVVAAVPVAFGLLIAGGGAIIFESRFPPAIILQRLFSPSQSFLLLAVPFFILAGELLVGGRLGQQMIRFASNLVGRFTGGLGHASVATSMLFAGVSGSAVADAAGLGSVLIPWQKSQRYPASFAGAVNAASSTVGVIIPPSIPMIVYSAVSGASVGALFLAGVIPGILLGAAFMTVCYVVARRNDYPRLDQRVGARQLTRDFLASLPAIVMPAVVIGAIIAGIATVTEVSVLAVVYALVLRGLVYRDLGLRGLYEAFGRAASATGVVMLLIMASSIIGWILIVEQVPEALTVWFAQVGAPAVAVILFMNLVMLLVGTFLDMPAAILVLGPVLLPLAESIGMDPLQFGIVMTLNLALGLFTPPVGTTLYISSSIAEVPIEQTVRSLVPFYVSGLVLLLLVSFVPALTIVL